jgi:cell division protein FtsQ
MKIFRLVTAIILCLAVLVGIVFAAVNMPKRPCSGYELVVKYDGEYPTVKEADIQQMIEDHHIETIGVPLKDVDLEQIAQHLQENPYIKTVNEVRFSSTKLRIVVTLKNLLLHVYAQDGSQYFVDEDGFMLPFSMAVTENVPVANGKIPDAFVPGKNVKNSNSNLHRVFKIAAYMDNDDFYRAQFRQLYVTNTNEVIMVPTVGRHKIFFGTDKNMEEKLFNLKQTYQQGLAYMGMDQYASLDVRYKNRVIAKKR